MYMAVFSLIRSYMGLLLKFEILHITRAHWHCKVNIFQANLCCEAGDLCTIYIILGSWASIKTECGQNCLPVAVGGLLSSDFLVMFRGC